MKFDSIAEESVVIIFWRNTDFAFSKCCIRSSRDASKSKITNNDVKITIKTINDDEKNSRQANSNCQLAHHSTTLKNVLTWEKIKMRVSFTWSFAFTSAPDSTSRNASSRYPLPRAKRRGVFPSWKTITTQQINHIIYCALRRIQNFEEFVRTYQVSDIDVRACTY